MRFATGPVLPPDALDWRSLPTILNSDAANTLCNGPVPDRVCGPLLETTAYSRQQPQLVKLNPFDNIAVLIPAYNPDERLLGLVGELLDAGCSNVVVVDDGSKPGCRDIFRKLRDSVFVTQRLRKALSPPMPTASIYPQIFARSLPRQGAVRCPCCSVVERSERTHHLEAYLAIA